MEWFGFGGNLGNVTMNWVLHDDKKLSLIIFAMKMAFWLIKKMPIYIYIYIFFFLMNAILDRASFFFLEIHVLLFIYLFIYL